MSYKKIILQCFKDLLEHYEYCKRKKRRTEIPYIEEEYFLVNNEEQKRLFKEFNKIPIKGKVKYYRSKSGRLWERSVSIKGLREAEKNKINPFPQIIKG